jgi:hypothetical protein
VVYTVSVYAKADGFDVLLARISTATSMGTAPTLSLAINLTTGVAISTSFGTYIGREAAANGYYRYIFQTNAIASATNYLSFVPSDTTATEGNGVDGISIWGAMAEIGDVATDYIATTTTAVSVGPVSGLPRLDYYDSTCPRLLLEPQRTNRFTQSEYLEGFIKSASGTGSNPTITSNYAISPDGFQNATRVQFDAGAGGTGSDISRIYESFTIFGTTETLSVYLKSADGADHTISLIMTNSNVKDVVVTDEWQRFDATQLNTSPDNYGIGLYGSNGQTADILVYGFQLETGTYPTSYIPTYGTSVTRVADDADTTFATAFATSGSATWLIEFDGNTIPQVNQTGGNFSLNFASGDYLAYNHNANPEHRFRVQADGSGYFAAAAALNANSPAKLAVSVTASSYVAYANGVQINTDSIVGNWASATSLTTTINDSFGSLGIKQMLFFPNALTATQLAELTTL